MAVACGDTITRSFLYVPACWMSSSWVWMIWRKALLAGVEGAAALAKHAIGV